jgi:GAF domain
VASGDRWGRVTTALAGALTGEDQGSRLCTACRETLSVGGTGITLFTKENRSQLCVSDDRTAVLEELQFTAGQGPSVEAFRGGRPIFETDLATDRSAERWPAFAGLATEAGLRGVFAFPLQVGAARIGVMTLYQEHSGSLTAEAKARPHMLADGLAAAGTDRAEVHQASGMISVQLGVGIAEALVRLRSFTYASGRPIGDVAADIVARRLHLEK